MTILQQMGNGVSRDEYFSLLGQRIELGLLLTQAKKILSKSWKSKRWKNQNDKKISSKNKKEMKTLKTTELNIFSSMG